MNGNELIVIAEKWVKAWNDRDHPTLVSMMKENSLFAQLAAMFEPIIIQEQALIPNLYVREWFHRKLEIVRQLDITFSIKKIKTGDGFVQVKSMLSDGKYVVDYLRVENDGKIDQIIRNVDTLLWVEIV